MPFITSSTKSINGCIYTNPLGETKVLTLEDIYTLFNINCGFPDGFPNNSDPSIEVRNMCDRDILRNKNETIRDVRGINGKTIFRSCDTWCSYWDKNCVFQVDVFIPTKAATAGEYAVLGSIMKVFSLNEKRLRNGWNTEREIPITEWLYLEGKYNATRLSLNFDSSTGLLQTIGWFVRENDLEAELEQSKARYETASFLSKEAEWVNSHAGPDDIYFSDQNMGLEIQYGKNRQKVKSITWRSPEAMRDISEVTLKTIKYEL